APHEHEMRLYQHCFGFVNSAFRAASVPA
ncbi:hypothetical protein H4W27_002595, partial [Nesterenkonia lutea]|nr:hypothetical protein [Nesterenkonia lutea]